MPKPRAPETVAAANGVAADAAYGAVAPPLHLSSTFAFDGFEREGPYAYSRVANPTRDLLADTLARLERGAGAVVTASGMAALDLVLSRLGPDDLVIAPHDSYGGSQRLLQARADRRQFSVSFVDQSDPAAYEAALEAAPSLVLIETPSNPLMRVVDIRTLCALARTVGAQVAVDNTFLSPALQRPLELGADYVVHSTTKFLNGHSDVVGGAVVAARPADLEALADWANITGVGGAPFDAYLTLRGVRTLFPRMERQQQTAGLVATFLDRHPQVRRVHYPGLEAHPGHQIARAQQSGFGAMLSFEVEGGVDAVRTLLGSLRIFTLAESLGGVESLVSHPVTMTHAAMSPQARAAAGIDDSLLRLSVGLESADDLLADLGQGLANVVARGAARRGAQGPARST